MTSLSIHRTDPDHADQLDQSSQELDQQKEQNASLSHLGPVNELVPQGQGPVGPEQDDPEKDKSHPDDLSGEPSKGESRLEWLPYIMVNILSVLVLGSYRFLDPLMDQYLVKAFATEVLGNDSVDTTSQPCLNTSHASGNASSQEELVKRVQDLATTMNLYISTLNYALAVPPCIMLGVFANNFSRRFLLMMPTFGLTFKCVLVPIILYWKLHRNWFYLGFAVDGICGSGTAVLLALFVYMSDISSGDHKRTVAIVITESAMSVFGGCLSVATGQLIQKYGFLPPALIAAAFLVTGMGIIVFLPNRKPALLKAQTTNWSARQAIKTLLFPVVYLQDSRVRKMLMLGIFAVFVLEFDGFGVLKITTLYMMNLPFCWDAITIGWFKFGWYAGANLFSVFAVLLLYRWLPGMGLGLLGTTALLASYLMFAFAQSQTELFINLALLIPSSLPVGVIRGETSQLLGPEHQGPLFAIIAVVESLSYATAAPIFLQIYRSSLGFFEGLAYVYGSIMTTMAFGALVVFQLMWVRRKQSAQFLEVDLPAEVKS